MTLNPVFRSEKELEFLKEQGYLEKFQPALKIQKKARDEIYDMVINHYQNNTFYGDYKEKEEKNIFEKDFFLILFNSLLLYAESELVEWYAKFNYCIKGEITAADNIFDSHEDDAKTTLPFNDNMEGKFRSIAELKTYGHLFHELSKEIQNYEEIKSELDDIMLGIGDLEASEEKGIDDTLEPEEMINQVHRIRGGLLFKLGMIAPPILESRKISYWEIYSEALNDIGTAFQIVDDITYFEFDLKRRSHNIVSAQIYHNGTSTEKSHFQFIIEKPTNEANLVEKYFRNSAKKALAKAYLIAEDGFKKLRELDFWYLPCDTQAFVNAIAGDQGTERLEKVLSTDNST